MRPLIKTSLKDWRVFVLLIDVTIAVIVLLGAWPAISSYLHTGKFDFPWEILSSLAILLLCRTLAAQEKARAGSD